MQLDPRVWYLIDTERRWSNFAITTPNRNGCEGPQDHIPTESRCGQPLGLSFNRKSGKLYIADAYKGLLVVGPNGGLATPLANEAEGVPFKFTNDVVVDQNSGILYFTDSSTIYPRRDFDLVISTRDKSGRLLKFEPKTNQVAVLLKNLTFPNGVALSKNGGFLLVAETTNCRILKYSLEPSKAGTVGRFTKLPGRPDNIKRNQEGEFWVAVNSPDNKINPFGLIVKLSQNGDVLKILEAGKGEAWRYSSDVNEVNENLWIGSVTEPYVAKLEFYSYARSEQFQIVNATGPESAVFDINGGGPYTGLSDGRIMKWLENDRRWTNFAITTPNSLVRNKDRQEVLVFVWSTRSCFHGVNKLCYNGKSGELYIADAYMGFLVVGPDGGLAAPLAKEAGGVPFKFTNDVVVDQNSGIVYFTDSSAIYSKR
ncbi:unnamed protein product [Coffea canephora]|uniref:Strictosidine synthase conserved region domain-containing protein n=1 Tax=Coffea canephora TaxID=49390 RepID=A0A068UHR7_COFCA|nr:unnamed protein product [Coffea canephora]